MIHRIVKWILWTAGLLLVMLTLIGAGVFFTPKVVSTKWFRHQVENRASRYLHHPVTIQDLEWTWQKGIRIKGFEADDDPQFGKDPILRIDQVFLGIDFELDPRRLVIDLSIDGLRAHLVRDKDGETNVAAWLSQMSPPPSGNAPAEPIAKGSSPPFVLPGDLSAQIKLTHAVLVMEDRAEDRLLEIQDGALTLNMPSLLSSPVDLEIGSRQSMDGKELPPLSISVHAEHLVNGEGSLNPRGAHVQVNGQLPGLQAMLSGSMAARGLEGEIRIDLASLIKTAKPFVPDTLPQLSGEILLQTNVRLQRDKTVLFDTNLRLGDVLAKGGPLKEKQIGPFSMTLSQKGNAGLADKRVHIDGGEMHFMEKSGFSFKGDVQLDDPKRLKVNLALNGISFDLDEMIGMAESFIPGGISWKRGKDIPGPVFRINEAQLKGTLPEGVADLSLKDMTLDMPEVHLQLSKGQLKAERLALAIPETAVSLEERFPKSLNLRLSLDAENVHLSGDRPVSLEKCRISSLDLAVKDMAQAPQALWGMAGNVTLKESGFLEGIRLPPQNDGTEHLSHRFKTEVSLPAAPEARIRLVEADLSAAPLKMKAVLPHPLKDGLTWNGLLKDVRIKQTKPLNLDITHFETNMRSGDALNLKIQGSVVDSGMTSFQSEGVMDMDLGELSQLIPPELLKKGRFSGRTKTKWEIQGRRPDESEFAALTNNDFSLEKRLQQAGFLKRLDLETALMNMDVTMPLHSGETVSIRGIQSEKPINVRASNGLKSLSFEGRMKVARIESLPSLGKLKNPLSADFSFDARARDFNSLELHEDLRLAPLALEQHLELSLNKLSRLLGKRKKPDLPAILKTLEAKIMAGISVNAGNQLAPFTREMALEGPLKGHLEVALRGGKSVSVKTRVESDGLDAKIPSKVVIKGLNAHISLEKTYGLLFGPLNTETGKSPKALSVSVLQPEFSSSSKSSGANPLAERLLEDLRGRLSTKPTLSFSQARLENGPFPIILRNAQVQMRLNQSLPAMDYFQMDVAGGTLLGTLRILEHQNRYRLSMDGAFGGLDAQRLLESENIKTTERGIGSGSDTQISGRLSLHVPIAADAETIMNDLDAVFRLTHIGSRTLERFLYAMDPHENNESIVQQRALLKKGTPRWIEVNIKNGSLSLRGEVVVGGSNIRLPAINRLNLSSLPIQRQVQTLAGRLNPLLKGLKIISAKTLQVKPDGVIDFLEDRK